MKWYVQRVNEKADTKMEQALLESGTEYEMFSWRPFQTRMPNLKAQGQFVLQGSCSLVQTAWKSKKYKQGIFHDPRKFKPSVYAAQYGAEYLNHDMCLCRLVDLSADMFPAQHEVFLRVNDDGKQIAGGTCQFKELLAIKDNAEQQWIGGDLFGPHSEIMLSSVKPILAEARFVVVNKHVVAGSLYRPYVSADIPDELRKYATKMANHWQPHDVFVLDVCLTDQGPAIVECNGWNSCGFYDSDMGAIVGAVNQYCAQGI